MRNFVAVADMDHRSAFEALHALERLDADGVIQLHESAVIERRPDGRVALIFSNTREPALRRPGIGALLGAVAGLSVGPLGAALGGAVGVLGGALDEALYSGASDAYIESIGEHLKPGTLAVVADLHENETGAIDSAMAELGRKVLRDRRRDLVEEWLDDREEARKVARQPPSRA